MIGETRQLNIAFILFVYVLLAHYCYNFSFYHVFFSFAASFIVYSFKTY